MLAPWVAWKSSFWLCLSKPVKGVLKYTLCFIVLKDQRPKLTGPRQKIIIFTIRHHCSGIVTWFFFSFHKTFSTKNLDIWKFYFFSFGWIPRRIPTLSFFYVQFWLLFSNRNSRAIVCDRLPDGSLGLYPSCPNFWGCLAVWQGCACLSSASRRSPEMRPWWMSGS